MSKTIPQLVDQLRRVVRRGRILTAPAQLAGYDADGLGYKTFRPDAVVIPADAAELAALLRDARTLNVPVTMRGAGTSLSGGPVAAQGGIVVHTSAMRNVKQIARHDYWCEVECSVVLNQLDAALAPLGLMYPPDPSSGPVCTLGGNVAMNAGGAHCFRYGVTSNYVLGVEAVLLDGQVQRFGGPAGGRGAWREDWKRLMVGSEGTLAAFTRFWLRVVPRPEKMWTYRATFPDLRSAQRAILALASHASFPVAIELMDPRCVAMVENSPMAVGLPKDSFLIVTEIDGPAVLVDTRAGEVAGLLRAAGASGVEWSDDELQRKKLWKARKVAGGLMGQISPDFLVQDAVIPKSALADLLQLVYDEADAAGLPAVNVFHAGDGNLHPNFLFDSRKPGDLEKVEAISKRLMQRVVAVGGTLSGEHGIGNDKTAYMPLVFGADTLRLQLAVPRVFNPRHQLNPLKVFASRSFATNGVSKPTTHGEKIPLRDTTPLFTPFLDAIDGVICLPATATAADLEPLRAAHSLRFPLLLDGTASLREQVASSGYAPASSRFGPFCDNILGMNWRLPSGQVVRIGERVVKSTTGYDLLRFFLNSQGAFGEPVDYVLRLRPDCGQSGRFLLSGSFDDLTAAVSRLLSTCWLHWFDAIDLLAPPGGESCAARITLNCPANEWPVYADYIGRLAAERRLTVETTLAETYSSPQQVSAQFDGCPDIAFKTTTGRVLGLARELAVEWGLRCVALCYNGMVHGYLPDAARGAGSTDPGSTASGPPVPSSNASSSNASSSNASSSPDPQARVAKLTARYADELCAAGGDWQSRHLPRAASPAVEREWLETLTREFSRT
jgi:glycolate oxidase subunit GlcD